MSANHVLKLILSAFLLTFSVIKCNSQDINDKNNCLECYRLIGPEKEECKKIQCSNSDPNLIGKNIPSTVYGLGDAQCSEREIKEIVLKCRCSIGSVPKSRESCAPCVEVGRNSICVPE